MVTKQIDTRPGPENDGTYRSLQGWQLQPVVQTSEAQGTRLYLLRQDGEREATRKPLKSTIT
jgi:hypothetical protein